MLTFCPRITSKVISGWIQWPDMQILFKFQVNRMKFEDFRKFCWNWLFAFVDIFSWPNFMKLQCWTIAGSVTLFPKNFTTIGWVVWAGGKRIDKQTNGTSWVASRFPANNLVQYNSDMFWPLRPLKTGHGQGHGQCRTNPTYISL